MNCNNNAVCDNEDGHHDIYVVEGYQTHFRDISSKEIVNEVWGEILMHMIMGRPERYSF